ncbi:hypothetical protein BDD12DRAFT_156629 [Trichophaea hybrida]|nr:hypothetical protein BDD12DRAFT_156629 [Trichophaea hybrida]
MGSSSASELHESRRTTLNITFTFAFVSQLRRRQSAVDYMELQWVAYRRPTCSSRRVLSRPFFLPPSVRPSSPISLRYHYRRSPLPSPQLRQPLSPLLNPSVFTLYDGLSVLLLLRFSHSTSTLLQTQSIYPYLCIYSLSSAPPLRLVLSFGISTTSAAATANCPLKTLPASRVRSVARSSKRRCLYPQFPTPSFSSIQPTCRFIPLVSSFTILRI